MTWMFYFPGNGETKSDAIEYSDRVCDAEDVAHHACEYDYTVRDGWERGMEVDLTVVVISPDGVETEFKTFNYTTVEHHVEEVKP